MRKRCTHCRGKGGWEKPVGFVLVHVSCQQCKGKGEWWTNNNSKKRRKRKK